MASAISMRSGVLRRSDNDRTGPAIAISSSRARVWTTLIGALLIGARRSLSSISAFEFHSRQQMTQHLIEDLDLLFIELVVLDQE